MRKFISAIFILTVFACVAAAAQADLAYDSNVLELTGLFHPQAIRLTSPPADVALPSGAAGDPGYGVIPLNGQGFPVLLYRDGDTVTLYVRLSGDGDFVPVAWTKVYTSGQHVAMFSLDVSYISGREPYALIAVWDPAYPTVLVYFRGGYRTGKVVLGDTEYKIAVLDENTDGRYDDRENGTLFIDTDRDGELLTSRDSHERFNLSEPFNIGGTVYAVESISADGGHIVIEESDTYVPEKLPLEVGFPAPDFSGTTAEGKEIALSELKGKIVLLDFWAGWCTPCLHELPNVKKIAADYAADLIVIGINLDRSEAEFERAVAENGLDYPQVFDSSDGKIAALYRVTAIPMSYLIDRNGKIVGKDLRGDALRQAVEELVHPGG